MSKALIILLIHIYSAQYGADPDFCVAVATIESRLKCGPLGKSGRFIGPMGIAKCFRAKWDIDDPATNIEVGVRALRGADKRRVLRRYNTAFSEGYYRAVMAIYWQAKREGKFDG
jgi:hypothetical protein